MVAHLNGQFYCRTVEDYKITLPFIGKKEYLFVLAAADADKQGFLNAVQNHL